MTTTRLTQSKIQRLRARLSRFTTAVHDARRKHDNCKNLPVRPFMPLAVITRIMSSQSCNIDYTVEQEAIVKREAIILRRYMKLIDFDLPGNYYTEYYALDDELRTLLRTLSDVVVENA